MLCLFRLGYRVHAAHGENHIRCGFWYRGRQQSHECNVGQVSGPMTVAPALIGNTYLTMQPPCSYVNSLKSAIEQAERGQPFRKRARRDSRTSASSFPGRSVNNAPATRAQLIEPEDTVTTTPRPDQPDDGETAPQGHQVQVQAGTDTQCASADKEDDGDASVRASISGISFLSRDAMAEPRGDGFENIPQRISTGNLVRAAVALHGANPDHPARPDPSLSVLMMMLPPGGASEPFQLNQKATERFMALFIDEVAILYPHFDRAQLEKQYRLVAGGQVDPRHSGVPSDADKFNAYMAVCIGTLLSSESTRLESYRTKLQSASLDLFDSLLADGDSLVPVACLILLTIHATYSPCGGSAWQLLGLTMRQCVFLGLHRDPEQHMHATMWSDADMDTRRRVFWTIYVLDRYPLLSCTHPTRHSSILKIPLMF